MGFFILYIFIVVTTIYMIRKINAYEKEMFAPYERRFMRSNNMIEVVVTLLIPFINIIIFLTALNEFRRMKMELFRSNPKVKNFLNKLFKYDGD